MLFLWPFLKSFYSISFGPFGFCIEWEIMSVYITFWYWYWYWYWFSQSIANVWFAALSDQLSCNKRADIRYKMRLFGQRTAQWPSLTRSSLIFTNPSISAIMVHACQSKHMHESCHIFVLLSQLIVFSLELLYHLLQAPVAFGLFNDTGF